MPTPEMASEPALTRIVPVGREWDAIRVPHPIGLAALGRLPAPHGPVIADPDDKVVYFLVPCGTARTWVDEPESLGYGVATFLVLPPETRNGPPGPYWLVAPASMVPLTDPEHLRSALRHVTIMGTTP